MKSKKVVVISIIAVLVVAVLIASYVLIVLPKKEETLVGEETEKVQEEKVQAGEVKTSNWNLNRVNIVYDTENVPVPVPKGYVASSVTGENTVNDGFVIYEGEEAVTDSNKESAQKTRNQWVWVPIYDASEIYGVDSEGMMHGKLYDYSDTGRTANNWTETNGVMSITSSTENREPDVITDYDKDKTLPSYISEETRDEINKELTEEFYRTIKSIEKYGGFYIGRYETGGLSGQAVVTKINVDIADQTWYTMYTKCKNLNGTNENVTTNMIYGNLWDATIEWLVDSGEKTYSEVGKDSTGWGNYSGATFTFTTTSGGIATKSKTSKIEIPTGSADYTRANNIYDMAGNVYDWTIEAYSTSDRRGRGGFCSNGGSYFPAGHRRATYDPDYSHDTGGCRASLYVKL